MKKMFFYLAAVISFFFISSCDMGVGLGKEVDLVAPEITITSPKEGDNVHKNVRIEGTCTDNIKVTEVEVVESRSGGVVIPLGKAVIKGDHWYLDVELEEGDRFIVCTVKDAAGNSSPKSKAVINLIVDDTPSTADGWYVDRGKNTQVSFMTKEKLETVDCGLVINRFIPQNEKFSIGGKFYDSISVAKVILNVYEDEETEPIIVRTITAEDITTGSIYAPEWDFTHDELVSARPTLNSGKHYLRVSYEVYDDSNNKGYGDVGYLLWYPESDQPGIEREKLDSDGKLLVNVGSSIPVHFFDDDELAEVRYAFVTEEYKNEKEITLDKVYECSERIAIEKEQTEYPDEVKTTYIAEEDGRNVEKTYPTGTYYLLLYVKEINGHEKKELIEVSLRDAKNPVIRINSPKENEKPAIEADGSTFTVKGVVNDTTGCKNVRVAYVPNRSGYESSAQKQARAKELFIDGSKCKNNEFVRTFTLPLSKPAPDDTGYVNEDFEFAFNLLTDFPSEMNASKFLMFVVEDIDKNQVFKQWVIGADSEAPEFKFTSPKDMSVVDYLHSNLNFRFMASKASGLGIKEESFVVKRDGSAGSKEADCVYTFANGKLTWEDSDRKDYILLTIPKSELQDWAEGLNGYKTDNAPIFNFECEDVVGNKGSARMTVVLSPLPALESITVDQRTGTYCAGTTITFRAKFTDTVKVTGSPRLKIGGIKKGASSIEKYADYVREGSTDSDTMKFECTVSVNEVSDGINCLGTGIELNGGKIETGTQGTGNATISFASGENFWDSADTSIKKVVEFDGIKPTITGINADATIGKQKDGYKYLKKNEDALVTVNFSEPVSVSGNVNFESNGLKFAQYSMTEDAKSITYSYKVASDKNGNTKTTFDNEELKYVLKNCFGSAIVSIKDQAGNSLDAGSNGSSYGLGVILDTVIPAVPSVNGLTMDIYNQPPVFTVERASGDSDIDKLEASLDNGQSWIDCSVTGTKTGYKVDANNKVTITTGGTYNIIARATDKAGNVSNYSVAKSIVFNDKFPEILDIKVDCENGNYKKGTVLKFKVFLADTVKPFVSTDARLTFETINPAEGSSQKTINVTANAEGSSVLEFAHTVTDGDKYNGVHIRNVSLSGLQDKYNNKQSTETDTRINALTTDSTGGCYRTGIKVDGSAPRIRSTVPANERVATAVDASGYLTVSITFDEPVYKESGTITLQRKGNWGIPAVMTVSEFNTVYNSSKLEAADREILMMTENGNGTGNELLDARTGIAVGPYRKITHGLMKTASGEVASGAPDTDTKFVLDFNLGLFSGTTVINPYGTGSKKKTVTVNQIREVFEKTGYHQHSLQMNSSMITTTDNLKYNIKFPVKVQEGIEWELIISEGSFRDEVGNLFKGLKSVNEDGFDSVKDMSYTLWTNKASIPVVRVDRYSHGYGAIEPKNVDAKIFDTKNLTSSANSTNFENITVYANANAVLTDNTGGKIEPTGYVRVRIDTQTPGAAINYRQFNKGAFDVTTGAAKSGSISWTRYKLVNGLNAMDTTGTSTTSANANYTFDANPNSSEKCSVSEIPDATGTELNAKSETFTTVSPDNTGVIIVVGDGDYKTARKDYVAAYATLAGATTDENASMTGSIIGAEGAFKTVIYSKKYQGNNQFNIEGGTFMGGEPKVSGFPVRDGESPQYSKNSYYLGGTDNQNIWNSYEIVSTNWAILLREDANSRNYPRSSYGQATYLCGYIHY